MKEQDTTKKDTINAGLPLDGIKNAEILITGIKGRYSIYDFAETPIATKNYSRHDTTVEEFSTNSPLKTCDNSRIIAPDSLLIGCNDGTGYQGGPYYVSSSRYLTVKTSADQNVLKALSVVYSSNDKDIKGHAGGYGSSSHSEWRLELSNIPVKKFDDRWVVELNSREMTSYITKITDITSSSSNQPPYASYYYNKGLFEVLPFADTAKIVITLKP